MTNVERFLATLNFQKTDRLPVIEWAWWWNQTINRWYGEGLSREIPYDLIQTHFGLDYIKRFWFHPTSKTAPKPVSNGAPLIITKEDYEAFKVHLYNIDNSHFQKQLEQLKADVPLHDSGENIIWFTFDGFFWYPRTLLGIENHLYSFYDDPDLYHRICSDHANFILKQIPLVFSILTPEFVVISEDMSYNNGPMISEEHFNEFMLPYYNQIIPEIQKYGVKVIIDSDGDITKMIPWFKRAGIDGVLPLERQAGVDIIALKEQYPDFIFIGGYDKMVMSKTEAEMRGEFERLLPAMKTGGVIPSCDHQTPPGVSLENYKIYVKLLKEYAQKACE